MKIVCFADTHGQHRKIKDIPEGDVYVFAGDVSNIGTIPELGDFLNWIQDLPNEKVVVAGNHDFGFYTDRCLTKEMFDVPNVHYLLDESWVYKDVKFYGSPWQPEFCSWAFNLPRGKELKWVWDNIPEDTNVLITHCPPRSILDAIWDRNEGCDDLYNRVKYLKDLQLHVFGHIHYSAGTYREFDKTFVNAAICTEEYWPVNKPIVIEI